MWASRRSRTAVERSFRHPAGVAYCTSEAGAYAERLESRTAKITARMAQALPWSASGLRPFFSQKMHASFVTERSTGQGMPFPSQFKPKKPVECDEQAVKRNNSHVSRQILCQRFIGETGRRPTCRGCVGGSLCSLPSSPVLSIIQQLARRWLGSVCMRDLALIVESTMRLCAT